MATVQKYYMALSDNKVYEILDNGSTLVTNSVSSALSDYIITGWCDDGTNLYVKIQNSRLYKLLLADLTFQNMGSNPYVTPSANTTHLSTVVWDSINSCPIYCGKNYNLYFVNPSTGVVTTRNIYANSTGNYFNIALYDGYIYYIYSNLGNYIIVKYNLTTLTTESVITAAGPTSGYDVLDVNQMGTNATLAVALQEITGGASEVVGINPSGVFLYKTSTGTMSRIQQVNDANFGDAVFVGTTGTKRIQKINYSTGVIGSNFTGLDDVTVRGVHRNLSNEYVVITNRVSATSGNATIRILNYGLTAISRQLDVNSSFATAYGVYVLNATGSTVVSPPVDNVYRKRLIAVGNAKVYYEDASANMLELTTTAVGGFTTGPLVTTEMVSAFEGYGKAFFVNGTEAAANLGRFRIADWVNTKLTTADIKPAGKRLPTKGEIIGKESGGAMGSPTFVVDNVICTDEDGGAFVLAKKITAGTIANADVVRNSDASVSFTASAAEVLPTTPHWYDWRPYGNFTNLAAKTYGQMPNNATFGCLYRGRCVLAGDKQYPHVWYMSRQGNPFDWAYAATDAQSPVAGNNADAGEIGDIVTCLAPYKDDYMIIGCVNSIWVMRGDPAAGGSLDEISLATGIFGPYAFCWDSNDYFYFFGANGLYRIPAGLGMPENISMSKLPKLVSDLSISPSTHRLTMGFDRRRHGILICITTLATGVNTNYWYDLRTEGFFPEQYPVDCAVFAQHYYEAENESYRHLLLGGADGYIRRFVDTAKNDDAGSLGDVAISSKAAIGPVQIGADDDRGRMTSLAVTTGSSTDGVNVDVYVKDTAEQVIDAIAAGSGALFSGIASVQNRVRKYRTRARGAWMGIVLKNETASQTWSFELAAAEIKPAGGI